MGERKVLNEYPPVFDTSKLTRSKRPENGQRMVEMMLPVSIRCNTCGNYICRGTKFRCIKEELVRETDLQMRRFRFYFSCTKCSADLVITTHPNNLDYVVENRTIENFAPWRAEDVEASKRYDKEMGDPLKSLLKRNAKTMMEIRAARARAEMKSIKSREATVSVDDWPEDLQRMAAMEDKQQEEESIFHG